jgi:hypothetical protein
MEKHIILNTIYLTRISNSGDGTDHRFQSLMCMMMMMMMMMMIYTYNKFMEKNLIYFIGLPYTKILPDLSMKP